MLLGLLLFLCKKLLPLRYSPEQMGTPLSELGKYRKYSLLSAGACILLSPLWIYACFVVLRAWAADYVPPVAQPVVAIRAGDGFWFAAALLPGIVLACASMALLERVMLGRERSAEYRMLSNRRRGFDATRGLAALGVLVATGSAAMGYFGCHAGLYLGRDELVVKRMWSLEEERYRYDEVKALREVRDEDRGKWNFVIQVKGAPDWSTEREVAYPNDEQKALLVERTGKAIRKGSGK